MCGAIERVPDVTCRALSGLGVLWRAMSRQVVVCRDKSLLDPPSSIGCSCDLAERVDQSGILSKYVEEIFGVVRAQKETT
jgi:hypothetical protein